MEVVCRGPFRARCFAWQPRPGAFALTVVCKATFVLTPGESPFDVEPADVLPADVHHEDDLRRSLRRASDLAPSKKRAEVVLTGHAFAPGGRPVPSLVARLAFQDVDKVVRVTGDSHISLDNKFSEPVLWSRMPLRWEQAAAAELQNPVGVRMGRDARADAWGRVVLPNLRPADVVLSSRWDVLAPVGFGPLSPEWPARARRLHRFQQTIDPRRAREWPLADDFDMSFFNVAPADQMVDEIAGDEELLLENLHPQTPRLKTRLARLVPRAHAEIGGGHALFDLRCDTLAIDTDSGTASLSWRGHIAVDHPERAERVVVSGQALTAVSAPTPASSTGSVRETVGLRGPLPGFVLPFGARPKDERPSSPGSGTERPPAPAAEKQTTPGLGAVMPPSPIPTPANGGAAPGARTADEDSDEDDSGDEEPVFPQQAFTATVPLGFARPVEPPAPEEPDDDEEEPVFPEAHRKTVDLASWMRPASSDPLPFRPAGAAPPEAPAPAPHLDSPAPPAEAPPPLLAPEPLLPVVETLVPLPAKAREQEFAPPPTPAAEVPAPPPLLGPLAGIGPAAGSAEPDIAPASPKEPTVDEYPIERCARIAASIAFRPADEPAILEKEELEPAGWEKLSRHWQAAIRQETTRGRKKLLTRYDVAYVAQLEALRGPLDAADYARLVIAAERNDAAPTLEALSLPHGSLPRIRRVWLRKVVEDASTALQVRAAMRTMAEE